MQATADFENRTPSTCNWTSSPLLWAPIVRKDRRRHNAEPAFLTPHMLAPDLIRASGDPGTGPEPPQQKIARENHPCWMLLVPPELGVGPPEREVPREWHQLSVTTSLAPRAAKISSTFKAIHLIPGAGCSSGAGAKTGRENRCGALRAPSTFPDNLKAASRATSGQLIR